MLGPAPSTLPPACEPSRQHLPPPVDPEPRSCGICSRPRGRAASGWERSQESSLPVPTAFPRSPWLCSRLSTVRLSWLIPASPERLAPLGYSRSLARLAGTGPPHALETPDQPAPHCWAGTWPARLSRAPLRRGPGAYSHFWSIYSVCSYKQGSKNNSSVRLGCPEMLRVTLGLETLEIFRAWSEKSDYGKTISGYCDLLWPLATVWPLQAPAKP